MRRSLLLGLLLSAIILAPFRIAGVQPTASPSPVPDPTATSFADQEAPGSALTSPQPLPSAQAPPSDSPTPTGQLGLGSPKPSPADPTPAAEPTGASPSPADLPSAAPNDQPEPVESLSYVVTFGSAEAFEARAALLMLAGVSESSAIGALRLATIDVPLPGAAERLTMLKASPLVAGLEPDRQRTIGATPNDPRYTEQWALSRIGWPSVWSGAAPTGQAVVAILDTGVDVNHPDLAAQIVGGASFVDGVPAGTDTNGHGTWMAGIVAATTDNGEGIAGVGLGVVRVMPVTVIGADGTGRDSDVINGIVYAVDHGANVILMAFASRGYSAALQSAVDYAWDADVVLVAAVGNDDSHQPTYPAGDAGVVGVSATLPDDSLWPSSNGGSAVFLAAPGEGIIATAPGAGYATISGTSAAAAFVAGSAALLQANHPGLPNGSVIGRLARSAAAVGSRAETGNGRLDLARAWTDTSVDQIKPAGVHNAEGGPYVGPYTQPGSGDGGPTYTVAAAGFRAAAENGVTSGVTSLVISKPSGTIAGDVMIAAIAVRPNTATISPPSGWTLIRRTNNTNSVANSQATYYRIAGSSEGSSYTWTLGASPTGAAGGIASFYNLSSCSLVDVENGQITANALTHAAPSVTTTASGDILVTTHSFASAANWTPPSGMNEAVDVASQAVPNAGGESLEMNYLLLGAAGATGAKTATASNDSDVGVGQTVALRSSCTKTWDGGAGTSNWGDANNWNPNGVPTASDNVSLTGANTINVNVAASTNDLTMNNASLVLTVNSGQSLTVTGNFTLSGGTFNTQASFPTVSGTTSIGAGTTVGYTAASGSQTVVALSYANLTISGGGTKTLAATVTPTGNLTVSGGTLDLAAFTANRASAGGTLTVSNGATLKIGGTGSLPSNYSTHSVGATSTIQYAGTTNTVAALNSSQSYGNLDISGTGVTTSASFSVATALTVNGGGSLVASAGTITMNNGSSIANSGTLTFRGLTIAASATVTTASSFSIAAAMTTGSGATFTPSGGTITLTGTAWTLALTSAPTFAGLTIAGTPASQPSASFNVGGVLTVNGSTTFAPSGGTVTMNNGSSIANSGTLTFQGLTIAASASVSASGTFAVAGTFTVSSSATFTPSAASVVSGSGTLTGSGTVTVTRTAATADLSSQYTIANKTLANLTADYAGASAQTISALTYGGLKLSNSSGATLAGATTVNLTLTLAGGTITTGAYTLVVGPTGAVSRTSGYVIGNLQLPVPTGTPNVTFDIGDATAYTPAALAFAGVTTAGSLLATTSAGDHAQIGSSSIVEVRSVNRTWTLTGSGIVFTTYDVTLNFVSGDVDAGATTAIFVVDRYSAGAWVTPSTGTRTSTSTQATGVPGFGDFAVGQPSLGIFTDAQDIGGPTIGGSSSHNSGTYSVTGSGADIWGASDQFQFLYLQSSGDMRITARIVSQDNSDPWAKAGVMIRESTAPGSTHAFAALTPSNGMAFQWRPTTDGASSNSNQTGFAAPYWVRLTRIGDTFTAERSPDGVTWTQQGTDQTISMAAAVYVGLAVTAHTNAALSTAVFDNVDFDNPPTTAADSYAAAAGAQLTVSAGAGVLANDSDPQNDTLSASLATDVSNGSLNLSSDGSFTYTPNGGFAGADSFTYRAYDGQLYSASATVTINVYASVGFQAEDYVAGSATGAGFSTLSEGSALGGQAITTNSNNTAGSGPPAEMVRYDVYFPDAGATNNYHLYVRYRMLVDSGGDDSGWALLPLDANQTVAGNWDQINDLTNHGDTTYRWVDLGATAGINGVASYTNVAAGLHSWWFGGREDGLYADAFVFSTGYSLDTTLEGQAILDAAVNDRPSALADAFSVDEDGTLDVSAPGVLANDTDPESDALTASLATNVSNGSLTLNANGSFSYSPSADFNGTDSFTYYANDRMVASASAATVTITVNSVNDVPSFMKGATQTVDEDAGAQSVAGWATAISTGPANEASQVVDFLVANDNNSLFSVQPAISAAGTLTYTPAADANGWALVSVRIHDDGGTANGGIETSAEQTFAIIVDALNDAPINTVPGAQVIAVNTALVLSTAGGNPVSIADIDAGSNPIQVQLTASQGTITLSGTSGLSFSVGDGTADATMTFSGTLTDINTALEGMSFTPANQFAGAAALEIVTNDLGATGSGGAASDTDSVAIDVQNAAPSGVDDSYSISQDNTLVVAAPGVLTNDTDPNPQTLSVQVPRPLSGPSNGLLTLNADGSFSYTPDAGFTGSDSFTYRLTDGIADSGVILVTIIVITQAYVSDSDWTSSFSPTRYLELAYPAYVAATATVDGATFRHSYRSYAGGTTCYYFEVYQGATLIATHGSSGVPVSCNSGSAYVSDTIALPEVNGPARANGLTVRLYLSNSVAGRSEHRTAELGVTYWLDNQ